MVADTNLRSNGRNSITSDALCCRTMLSARTRLGIRKGAGIMPHSELSAADMAAVLLDLSSRLLARVRKNLPVNGMTLSLGNDEHGALSGPRPYS